jgi:putative ABC transport system permease protein
VSFAETDLTVLGTHPHPFRFIAYIDVNHTSIFAPIPLANLVTAQPRAGLTADDAKRALFEQNGVSSVQSVSALAEQIRDLLEEFVIVLRVVEGAMLLIALLIAFNSSSISMDERTREHATMFAFGVPLRTVLGMAMLENLILGIFATAVGLGAGWLLLGAIMATRVADTFPDIDMTVTLGTTTVAITLALGIVTVCLAPLLDVWRLRSMDVPAKLKVME